MIPIEKYRDDPCGTLSIPYWKVKNLSVPPNMRIVHERDFDAALLEKYADRRFFRLIHRLENIPEYNAADFEFRCISADMLGELSDMINRSYEHTSVGISVEQLKAMTASEVYCPELWIGAFADGKIIGSIICEFDKDTGEAAIEWLQVLPEYRNCGIAYALVCRALNKIRGAADFATVSGKCDDPTAPERVYRKCGFTGDDVWHILKTRE